MLSLPDLLLCKQVFIGHLVLVPQQDLLVRASPQEVGYRLGLLGSLADICVGAGLSMVRSWLPQREVSQARVSADAVGLVGEQVKRELQGRVGLVSVEVVQGLEVSGFLLGQALANRLPVRLSHLRSKIHQSALLAGRTQPSTLTHRLAKLLVLASTLQPFFYVV